MKIIASLTSYPARIDAVYLTIESILNQTLKPDEVILWLAKDEFKDNNELPKNLTDLTKRGLTIKWCDKNLRSFNKLIHSLKEYPNDIIITFDDDTIYDKDCVKLLYNGYLKYPNFIQCHRALKITSRNGEILPYNDWIWGINSKDTVPSYSNFFTACNSVLYPPKCFYKDIFCDNIFLKLCPREDDAWFWAMAVLNGTKINVVEDNITLQVMNQKASQEYALWKTNVDEGQNTVQLKNIIECYPEIYQKIIACCVEKISNNNKNQEKKSSKTTTRIKLFFIPLLKVIRKNSKIKIKILNIIPFFEKKELNSRTKIFILGVKILTIKTKGRNE